ncbi:MAG: M1 family metallopeptidase [Proteobacteria bacterium]|nr:M1 family metallopeptidase [Pseudomonadota bacterium]
MARDTRHSRTSYRLDPNVRPLRVAVHVELDPERGDRFRGHVRMDVALDAPANRIALHAADLRVTRPRVEVGGRRQRLRMRLEPDRERVVLEFESPLPAGRAVLELAYAGRLRRDLCGLYAARSGDDRYAFTQLEPADARKFFPCFDEPDKKAPFTLSVTTAAHHAVVSNAPVARKEILADGRQHVTFAPTPPLSSYLVALAVGNLVASRRVWVGDTAIRVWSVPGKRRLARFGLEAARECLARLERYFALPYPYAKLDLVAVPDFEFGAMENAGAVFFRETLLLLDDKRATLAEKKRAAEVICHELAHMWYGDLVTMAWWDDLWLNEAFATWMAFHVVDQWKPEWRMWHDFQHGRAAALDLDGLSNTHPIYCTVRTPEDANANFDLITYEKGASVVRMLERFLGRAAFRKGVRRYIRRHREGNAVAADLWTALSEASGVGVEPIVRAWIEQPGHPVVSIRTGAGGALTLRQERFRERNKGRSRERWPVPVVLRVGAGRGRGTREERVLLERASQSFRLRRGSFVYGNALESGFFRPLHASGDWTKLVAAVKRLRPIERMGLLDHQWALARTGRAPLSQLLDVVDALSRERDADVLASLVQVLAALADPVAASGGAGLEARLERFAAARFGPALRRLGLAAVPGESEDARVRRATLFRLVGGLGRDPAVLAAAARLTERALGGRRVEPNLLEPALYLAGRDGDPALYAAYAAARETAATPQEERRFLVGLGTFEAPALVERSLRLSLSGRVATQDVVILLARLLANRAARERTWAYLQEHWPRVRKAVPPLLAGRLISATLALGTRRHRTEVARFFRAHPLPAGERALRQTLERFDALAESRRRLVTELDAALPD